MLTMTVVTDILLNLVSNLHFFPFKLDRIFPPKYIHLMQCLKTVTSLTSSWPILPKIKMNGSDC